jgi:hypothetical protein
LRVDWAIPCRYAEVNDNLATIVGAGIDHMFVPALPAPVQVVLAVRLVSPPDEVAGGDEHPLGWAVLDDQRNTIAELGGMFAPAIEGAPADWLVGLHLPIVVIFPVEVEGTYTIELTVDDHTYSVPMHVHAGSPQPPAASQ